MKQSILLFFTLLNLTLCAQTERKFPLAELLSAGDVGGYTGTIVTKILTEELTVQTYDGLEEFRRVAKAEYTVAETVRGITVKRRVVEGGYSEGKALSNGSTDLTGCVLSGVLLPRKVLKKPGERKGFTGMVASAAGDTVVVTIDKHAAIGDAADMKVMGTQLAVEKSDEELIYISSSGDLRLCCLKNVRCRQVMKERPKNGASHRQEWLQEIKILSVATEKK